MYAHSYCKRDTTSDPTNQARPTTARPSPPKSHKKSGVHQGDPNHKVSRSHVNHTDGEYRSNSKFQNLPEGEQATSSGGHRTSSIREKDDSEHCRSSGESDGDEHHEYPPIRGQDEHIKHHLPRGGVEYYGRHLSGSEDEDHEDRSLKGEGGSSGHLHPGGEGRGGGYILLRGGDKDGR